MTPSIVTTLLTPLALSSTLSLSDALIELDQFIGFVPLEQSFLSAQTATQQSESCVSTSRCSSFHFHSVVTESEAEKVVVEDRGSDGKIFARTTLTPEKWQEWNGNLIRAVLAATESYGFVLSLESLSPSQREVDFNGEPRIVETRILQISGANRMGMKTALTLEVCAQCGGLGQLVSREKRSWGNSVDRSKIKRLALKRDASALTP